MVQGLGNAEETSPDEFLGFTIVRLAHVLQQRMDAALQAEAGVTVQQFGALSYLANEPGIGSGALARKLLITPQSTGPLVKQLARRGLVARDDDAPDGTRKSAHLTAQGNLVLRKGYAVALRFKEEEEEALAPANAGQINEALLGLLGQLTRP